MNRFGSNIHRVRKIKCQKIVIKNFQHGSQNGRQDGGTKL